MSDEIISEREEISKILVVDDEPRNVKILQIQLKARGYTVYTAADGLEALDVVEKEMPDLILLDINMPRMDGFQVVERIRADETTEFIPIVMITALRDTRENRIKSIEVGADDFIEKPFDSVEVLAVSDRCCVLRRIRIRSRNITRDWKRNSKWRVAFRRY